MLLKVKKEGLLWWATTASLPSLNGLLFSSEVQSSAVQCSGGGRLLGSQVVAVSGSSKMRRTLHRNPIPSRFCLVLVISPVQSRLDRLSKLVLRTRRSSSRRLWIPTLVVTGIM